MLKNNKDHCCDNSNENYSKNLNLWDIVHLKIIEKKCKSRELAEFLYNCRNKKSKIKWIPFNEFRNIEPLTKGGCGVIRTADWVSISKLKEVKVKVVLKSIYNSQNVIS